MSRRILSTLLVLAIFLTCIVCIPVQAQAAAVDTNDLTEQETISALTVEDEEEAVLSNLEPIARLYAEEGDDLYKIVYLNADGTRTMHLYDYPVKYRDASGEIHDISLEIADGNTELTRFHTASNSVMTIFPANASDGIALSSQDVNIELIPCLPQVGNLQLSTTGVAKRIDSKTISYDYDAKTTIEYSLTYTGFKEDIVVSEYTGQTEYEFLLQTNGLALTQIDGSFYLTDESGTIKASIGDIIVFTADEKNNTMGTMRTETLKENHSYLLTIVLDSAYLADPNTAYPIRIDPTITINDTSGSGAIEDVTIYSNVTPDGASTSLFLGLRETRGISRVLMRFPSLNWGNSTNVEIHSATVTLRDLICEGTYMTVSCHPFTGANWTESTASWDMAQSWGNALSTQVISYHNGVNLSPKHRYSFDITNLATWWFNGSSPLAKGIIFKAEDAVENGTTYQQRQFASYNRNSYQPTFTMTYTVISSTDNILQDNVVVPEEETLSDAQWYDKYHGQNCYGYAIGLHGHYQPGCFSAGSVPASGAAALANLVAEDLEALGYTVSQVTSTLTKPVIITEKSKLICIRTANDGSAAFHFMVMNETGVWYQKQNNEGPLIYTGVMDASVAWVHESYKQENGTIVYTRREDVVYEGEIWYIQYWLP